MVAEYRAIGVVEGVFLADRGVLLTLDGRSYPAAALPGVARWAKANPLEAAAARFHIVYPRTVRDGVAFSVVESLTSLEAVRDARKVVGEFRVSGVITNQRSKKGYVVVRVGRNKRPPIGRHREAQFKMRLIWLRGRVAPAAEFVGKHVSLRAVLKDGELVLRGVELAQDRRDERFVMGGVVWPWPFHKGVAAIKKLGELNPPEGAKVLPLDSSAAVSSALAGLKAFVSKQLSTSPSTPEHATNADRLRLIYRRIKVTTDRLDRIQLDDLIAETGFLSVLRKVDQLTETPPPMPTATPEAKVELTAAQADLAEKLLRGWVDGLFVLDGKMTTLETRQAIADLMRTGWYGSLTDEQRRSIRSYRVKRIAAGFA